MDAELANSNYQSGVLYRLVPAVLPVLLISIGYVDPGKWAVIIEGGAHFGFELVALMLVFNFAAIFCQYLSARIAVVTGKDLAQICGEEYDKWTCVFIGVQTELSVILLDLTMVLGIAHGLNLLMGVELSTCVFLAAADAILFPFFAGQLENHKAKFLLICTAGIILLSYVLGVLISQPEIPLSVNGMLTKFSGDSAFSIMSLLGASMMPHNFYLHSSIVRRHQGQVNISKGALCHDHFFAILCIFSGIYMVNYVLMNSAANLFYSTGLVLLTFQDAMSLMEQVFRSPVVPFAFVLVLFFSNQIIAVNWNLSGQVVLQDFLRLDIPGWLHHATIRIISIVPALYCVWTSGAEGVYQLLILTQVMVAIMLPSSVIPLFRVASSRQIMGVHKISQYHEFLVLITFMGMLVLKLIFMVEMIFGNSDWVGNLRWNMGGTVALPFAVFLITTFTSLSLMLWLATTPLKSASSRNNAQDLSWDIQQGAETFTEREEDNSKEARYFVQEPVEKQESVASAGKSAESQPDASVTNFDLDLPETIMESDQEIRLAAIEENHANIAFPSPTICFQEESASALGSISASTTGAKDVTGDDLLDGKSLKIKSADPVVKTVPAEGDLHTEKDDDEADSWEPETELETEESSKDAPESTSALTSDGPASLRSLSGKSDDGGSSVGSLSRLVGLGRAARRQLATVLDEFWGQLYDYHGQMTQEARTKKLDLVLGVDSKPASSLKIDTSAKELSGYIPTVGSGPDSLLNSSLYDSPKQRLQNSMDSSYGVQRGSSSLWSNQMQLVDPYAQNANHNVHDSGERRYSSLRIPSKAFGERRYSSLRTSSEDSGERRYSSLRFPLEDSGERRYSSLHIPSEDSSERRYSGLGIPSEDSGERRYSSLRTAPSSDSWNYQPATVHGFDLAHLSRMARDRNSDFLNGQRESPAPKSPSLGPTNFMDSVTFALGQKLQNGISTVQASGFQQNLVVSRSTQLQSERSYFDVSSSGPADCVSIPSSSAKKYHSLPDISGLSFPLREQYMSNKGARVDGSIAYKPSIGRPSYEPPLYSNPGSRAGTTLAFDELSPSKICRDSFPVQLSSGLVTGSLWSRQPFEQFGVADKSRTVGEGFGNMSNAISQEATSIADAEAKLLQSFRHCIVKILKLEGSEWLFRHNDGADEDLIDRVAAREKFLYEAETREINQVVHMGESHYLTSERKLGSTLKNDEASFTNFMVSSVPHCGDGCIWKVDLILSFGVWCIHRILNLSLMESRPELWGKYTYVLNRLQGVIDLAFSRPRSPMSACFCLQIPAVHQKSSPPHSNGMLPPAAKPGKGKCTTAATLLDLIKDVENAISSRRGRTGTAAGDVAFPKGKENLASVLKRYKRRLSNKPAGTHEVSGPWKVQTSSAYGS